MRTNPRREPGRRRPGRLAALAVATALLGLAAVDSPAAHAALPFGPYTCAGGYVWRAAFAGDTVCSTPADRSTAATENALAASRREPGGGAWGPNTCKSGFVWRVARPSDLVCVPVSSRDREYSNNVNAVYRLQDPSQTPWGGVGASTQLDQTGGWVSASGSGMSPGGQVSFYAVGQLNSGLRYGPYSMSTLTASSTGSVSGWLTHLSCMRQLTGPVTIVVLDKATGNVTTAGTSNAPNRCGFA